jgi:hypothetical protein
VFCILHWVRALDWDWSIQEELIAQGVAELRSLLVEMTNRSWMYLFHHSQSQRHLCSPLFCPPYQPEWRRKGAWFAFSTVTLAINVPFWPHFVAPERLLARIWCTPLSSYPSESVLPVLFFIFPSGCSQSWTCVLCCHMSASSLIMMFFGGQYCNSHLPAKLIQLVVL